jgi:hypothetical protein
MAVYLCTEVFLAAIAECEFTDRITQGAPNHASPVLFGDISHDMVPVTNSLSLFNG